MVPLLWMRDITPVASVISSWLRVKDRCAAYTPVPGGVGPMTINTLIFQTVASGEKSLA